MADKKLEEVLVKHNYYMNWHFYRDFSNSTGSLFAYFTISVNRTHVFLGGSHCSCLGLLQGQNSSHIMINTGISYSTQAKAV